MKVIDARKVVYSSPIYALLLSMALLDQLCKQGKRSKFINTAQDRKK